ncbi:Uncharacterised protein [Listeria grayi]|uniref:Cyclic nucleotide-binding domain-containing protein n=1 Tax=Listeria grayi FSL F6-1183 TaxID=1265827 RepID=A0A829R9U8_LISGR|nr:hypothetical protein [Listeria grayi]EUJ28746.1 hypothetical protein LMUR_06657 [Listeria grayi FSL F6-1183]VEI36682.1 Uncharacterised protein [Listeria grayi]
MRYSEFQQHMQKDNFIYKYIMDFCKSKRIKLERKQKLILDQNKIYFCTKGVLELMLRHSKKSSSIVQANQIIQGIPREGCCYEIRALTKVEVAVYESDELYDFLENRNLLSHYLYSHIYMEEQRKCFFNELSGLKVKERVERVIQEFSDGNKIPEWFSVELVSKMCNCSYNSALKYSSKRHSS